MAAKRLYLIDAYSVIFRAFYAIRNLSNSRGEPTNAVYGFVNMLRKLLREQEPGLVGLAFDLGKDTVRRERYAEYKANRAATPDDLKAQIPVIRKVIEAFKIPILQVEKYEADDVLGTIARKASEAGYDVILVSADKDLMQLIGPRTFMMHTGRDKLYDAKMVEEDFGVPPGRVVDVLALMGDTSDNVPGVKGIGEKGAKSLIQEYGSLDALLEAAPTLTRKAYREGLTEHRDDALMSKELVTIHTDLPIDFDPEALKLEEPDADALIALYRELEFFSLIEELEASGTVSADFEVEPATLVETPAAWRELASGLPRRVTVAVLGFDEPVAFVVGGKDATWLADFRVDGLREAVAGTVAEWLADPERTIAGHDLKEVVRLAGTGDSVSCSLVDSMLLAYLLPSAVREFSLTEVSRARLHAVPTPEKEIGWKRGTDPPQPYEEGWRTYAAEHVAYAARLLEQEEREIEEEGVGRAAKRVYREIEEPLMAVLVGMEETGVLLDTEFLGRMSGELADEIGGLEAEIYAIAGEEFNINSPQQLGSIMFEKLDYPVQKRTRKTKSYATGADTLEALAAQGFDLPAKILQYRESTKLKSTYVDALPQLVGLDGRLHTRFQQAVAATGRLSSINPNLQNIPIRTENGRRIRKAFRAPEGRVLFVADYSQIELRVLAHIAGEEALVEAFRRGEDIHASTAAAVFGGSPGLVTPDQRRAAKVINFGILYGMSPFGLSNNLGIPQKEAKAFIEAYLERYPKIRAYIDETIESAGELGRVETLYGRARWLPDIRSKNWNLRENAKRMAINARIQGTAADLLKKAMIDVDRRLRSDFPEADLLLTVHDELVLEVPEAGVEALAAMVTEAMEGVEKLAVPLEVESGWGPDWYAAKG